MSDEPVAVGAGPAAALAASPAASGLAVFPAAVPARPARILVVDDELGIREGCRKILASEGYEVVTAGDGKAGLEQFQERGPFSVLLVDLLMPRMSGLELMREILNRDPDILPIIITAHATLDSAVEGTRQGAYSYIPKPFTPDELLLAIRNGLERRNLALEARRLREERERRLLEVASERSRSNTIIAAMTDGILVINMEKLVVLRNNAAARFLPDCAHLPLPFPLDNIPSPDVREIVGVVIEAPGGFMILSRQIPLGSGTYMVNVSPIIEPNGETSGVVAVFSDVTEMKKLDTAKSMFISMVAHEVKSPLAATEGWLGMVLGSMKSAANAAPGASASASVTGASANAPAGAPATAPGGPVLTLDSGEQTRMLERALLRVRTLRALVNELLSLNAIQTGNFSLKRTAVDVPGVVAEVLDASREAAAARGITLELLSGVAGGGAFETPPVLADRDALRMIYGNLVENAVKYSHDKGRVTVRIGRAGLYVTVSVRDEGIGMAPEECTRVFDEFYRVRNEATAGIPGTGLGLSLVKRLTELHEGTVAVTSEPGKGSEFIVSIPSAVLGA